MLTQEELKCIFNYNPETGLIKYINPKYNQQKDWFPGLLGSHGYYMIQINRKSYLVHRLIFLYMTGKWPSNIVDHINRNKKDNSWSNLRDTDRTINNLNKVKANKNNLSGKLGVAKHPNGWTAQLKIKGKKHHLGLFNSIEEAEKSYLHFKSNYANFG